MPMRQDCKFFESRTYANGETVRKCDLDLAPDAPWRCPSDCPAFERRLADVNWSHGTLVTPETPEEPPGFDELNVRLAADDWTFGWNAGLLWEIDEESRIGFAYRR